MGWILGLLAKAGIGALTAILGKLITRTLFQSEAETLLIKLLTSFAARTSNTLDDAMVKQVVSALQGPG